MQVTRPLLCDHRIQLWGVNNVTFNTVALQKNGWGGGGLMTPFQTRGGKDLAAVMTNVITLPSGIVLFLAFVIAWLTQQQVEMLVIN